MAEKDVMISWPAASLDQRDSFSAPVTLVVPSTASTSLTPDRVLACTREVRPMTRACYKDAGNRTCFSVVVQVALPRTGGHTPWMRSDVYPFLQEMGANSLAVVLRTSKSYPPGTEARVTLTGLQDEALVILHPPALLSLLLLPLGQRPIATLPANLVAIAMRCTPVFEQGVLYFNSDSLSPQAIVWLRGPSTLALVPRQPHIQLYHVALGRYAPQFFLSVEGHCSELIHFTIVAYRRGTFSIESDHFVSQGTHQNMSTVSLEALIDQCLWTTGWKTF